MKNETVGDEITLRDLATVTNLHRSVCMEEILNALWTIAALFSYGLRLPRVILLACIIILACGLISMGKRYMELEAVLKMIKIQKP